MVGRERYRHANPPLMILDKAAIRAALGVPTEHIDYPQLIDAVYDDLAWQASITAEDYLAQFAQPIALWKQALGIYSLVVTGHAPFLVSAETPSGRLRVAILSHGVGSAKAALDLLLAEVFTLAFAAVVQLIDVVIQHRYLGIQVEDVENWPRSLGGVAIAVDSPTSRSMISVLRRHAIYAGDETFPDAAYWHALSDRRQSLFGWILPELDPTATGLHVLDHPGANRATTSQRLVVLGLYYGLTAMDEILAMLEQEFGLGEPIGPSYDAFTRDLDRWLETLRPAQETGEPGS